MIPHMVNPTAVPSSPPTLLPCAQPVDVPLLAARDRQRAGGHVLGDRRAGGDVGACADRHRRDQLRVAADERAVLDDGRMLLHAVVVAGNRAAPTLTRSPIVASPR